MSNVLRKLLATLAITVILTVPTLLYSQGTCISGQVIAPASDGGAPVSFAQIRVCTSTATGVPCSPLATSLYLDPLLTSPITIQPFSTDINGNWQFCSTTPITVPTSYNVQATVTPGLVYPYYLTLPASASANFASPPPIGNTTPNSGSFTTLTSTGGVFTSAQIATLGNITPGTVNATSYSVNGTLLSSTNLTDSANLARYNAIGNYSAQQNFNAGLTATTVTTGAITAASTNTVLWPQACGNANPPSWCAGSDVGAWTNAAISSFPLDVNNYPQGIIGWWRANQQVWSTKVIVTSPSVSIYGQGSNGTTFNCTASTDCLLVQTSPFTISQAGNFSGFTINGNGGASQDGIRVSQTIGAHFSDIVLNGFNGASGTGLWFDNVNTGTWTERNSFDKIWINNSTKLIRFSVEAGNPSFAYTRMLDMRLNPQGSQTSVSLENSADVYGGTFRFTMNLGGTANTVWSQTGTSIFQSELYLDGEQNGSAGTMFNIGATSFFTPSSAQGTWSGVLPPSTFTGNYNFNLAAATSTGNPMIPGAVAFLYNPLEITNTGQAATYNALFTSYAPSMTSGQNAYWGIGQTGTANNYLQVGFNYTNSGSTANYAYFGIGTMCEITTIGGWSCPSFAGTGTATFAAGAAAGTSPGVPACTASHVCDSVSGDMLFTVGTATTSGTLLTVTFGTTRSNDPNCSTNVFDVSGGGTIPIRPITSATTLVFNTSATPTASHQYELTYLCGGQ